MRLFVAIIAVCYCAPAFGGTLPSLDDVPIMWANDPRYTEATKNLQKALLRQFGITDTYSKIDDYVSGKISRYGDMAKTEIAYGIDNYTPVSSKDVFAVVGTAYVVAVKRHISKSFHNPWWHRMTHTVDIGTNGCTTGIQIPF